VPVVLDFDRRVDPQSDRDLLLAVLANTSSIRFICDGAAPSISMSNISSPRMPNVSTPSPGMNCSGSTPMPTRLLRWMRSKLFAITAFTPSSCVPLAAQSRDDPVPYSSPPNTTVGTPSFM